MAIAPQRVGIGIRRHFTTAGVHPYDEVRVGAARRPDHQLPGRGGGLRAARRGGARDLEPQRHQHPGPEVLPGDARHPRARVGRSRQVADRVVDTITAWGIKDGYFADDEEAETFRAELKYLIVHQKAAFNSPVWFNIGVAGVPQQGSACFILVGRGHHGLHPQLVHGGGHDLQGRLGGRGQPLPHPLLPRAPEGRRHGVGPGELHAGRRRVGRHHQVGRQDPPGRQDGHPRRRPPRHRGLHLVQGHRGAQGPGAARRRVRHGPRRQGRHQPPVPERQQLGAGDRRVHAGRGRRAATGT